MSGYTREDFATQALELLPPGKAWPTETNSIIGRTFRAIGDELVRVEERLDALERESDPRRTVEMLQAWEEAYGLPGQCETLAPTIELRRKALVVKVTDTGDFGVAEVLALAEKLGWPGAEVIEYGMFRAGDFAGDLVPSQEWVWAWRLRLPPYAAQFARAGIFAAGEPIQTSSGQPIACEMHQRNPAEMHLIISHDLPPLDGWAPWPFVQPPPAFARAVGQPGSVVISF